MKDMIVKVRNEGKGLWSLNEKDSASITGLNQSCKPYKNHNLRHEG